MTSRKERKKERILSEKEIQQKKKVVKGYSLDIPIFEGRKTVHRGSALMKRPPVYPCTITTKDKETFDVMFYKEDECDIIIHELLPHELYHRFPSNKQDLYYHINKVWDSIRKFLVCTIIMNRLVTRDGVLPLELGDIIKRFSFALYQQEVCSKILLIFEEPQEEFMRLRQTK